MMKPKNHRARRAKGKGEVSLDGCKDVSEMINRIHKEDPDLADRLSSWYRSLPSEIPNKI